MKRTNSVSSPLGEELAEGVYGCISLCRLIHLQLREAAK